MSTKVISFLTLLLLLSSCEKDFLIPSNEVPDWLKSEISQDEQTIKEQPRSMTLYGGWLRYSWRNEYYFEYHNVLSSSLPLAISYSGDTKIPAYDINLDYNKEKCCKTYVWKGPKYNDYEGI